MRTAVRAIIIENDNLLVMHRNKEGNQYFTLVGGLVSDNETVEQALKRKVHEETGLNILKYRLVFSEEHAHPYNDQYIYLCEVAEHQPIAIQSQSEESYLNQIGISTHEPRWVGKKSFPILPFRTPQLQKAICDSLRNGFPDQPLKL